MIKKYTFTPLKEAAERGDLEMLKEAVDLGDLSPGHNLILVAAVEHGQEHIVSWALENGATFLENDRFTLGKAAEAGHLEVVKLVLEYDRATNDAKDVALWHAAEKGHTPIVQLLIESGADIHYDGDAALAAAMIGGHHAIRALLVGAAGKEAPEIYKEERDVFAKLAGHLLTAPLESRLSIFQEPKLLAALQWITMARMADTLFSPSAWPGGEGAELARSFHAKMTAAFPEEKNQLDLIDLTAFRPPALSGSFVNRLPPKERLAGTILR